jgi:L-threonylcarbamoyladenylate synthase
MRADGTSESAQRSDGRGWAPFSGELDEGHRANRVGVPASRVAHAGVRELIERAVQILHAGGLVAFPTETVYGLGADARNERALLEVFRAKGRPSSHPLIVHLPSVDHLDRWARDPSDEARALVARFWPGPLTLVLTKHEGVLDAVTGGQPTVGLRMPDHPIASELLRAFGDGLAAPSANRFGSVSPTSAEHVREELGESVELVLDGGPCRVGVESTILDLHGGEPHLLRPGGVPREAIEALLGRPVRTGTSTVRAPGTLASHYAPRAQVRAVAPERVLEEAERARRNGQRVAILAATEHSGFETIALPDQADARARRLYAALREVDARGFEVAIVALPDERGIDAAVADRLRRASAPRIDGT